MGCGASSASDGGPRKDKNGNYIFKEKAAQKTRPQEAPRSRLVEQREIDYDDFSSEVEDWDEAELDEESDNHDKKFPPNADSLHPSKKAEAAKQKWKRAGDLIESAQLFKVCD